MDAIFQRYKRHEGRFGTGRQLCLGLTWGRFWTLRQGCSNLYRGQGHIDNIEFEHILIVSDSKAKLDLGGDLTHKPETDYFYAVRRVSGTGKQEQGTQAVVKLSLDENGQRRPSRPNCIRDLRAQPAAEGRIRLCWWYWRRRIGQYKLRPGVGEGGLWQREFLLLPKHVGHRWTNIPLQCQISFQRRV